MANGRTRTHERLLGPSALGAATIMTVAAFVVLAASSAQGQEAPATAPAAPAATPAAPAATPTAPAAARAVAADRPASRYKELREVTEPSTAKLKLPPMLNSGTITDQALFDAFFQFKVAELTLKESGGNLPELRKKLKQTLQMAKEPARSQAIAKILPALRALIADPQYSPAARLNAVLILGDLNKTEPDFSGKGAIPLAETQADLLKLIDNDGPTDSVNDALRAAALIGLERHADGPMSDDGKRQLSTELRELIASATPPAGRSAEVHEWLTGRAKGILEVMGAGARAEAAPAP